MFLRSEYSQLKMSYALISRYRLLILSSVYVVLPVLSYCNNSFFFFNINYYQKCMSWQTFRPHNVITRQTVIK